MISISNNSDVQIGVLSFKASTLMGIETTTQFLDKSLMATTTGGCHAKSKSSSSLVCITRRLMAKNVFQHHRSKMT
ncbi:hypothetical protein RN001_004129 [Aquatica leii]|uniref:Uncharacterized protein n=1 Tax=Aquatica leii TaxID=1421715 RepID=A0AAN7PJJ5_9COLE|nr:hypothetical protein RN001_004129 [Aquatica leii]